MPILRLSDLESVDADAAGDWRSQGIGGAMLQGSLAEVQAAASILSSAGITHNFLWVDSSGNDAIHSAAAAARSQKLVGLVVDLTGMHRSMSGTLPLDEVQDRATDPGAWGHAITEAAQSGHPAGEIVVLLPEWEGDDLAVATVMAGACEGASNASVLHFAFPLRDEPSDARVRAAHFQRLLRNLRDPAEGNVQGSVGGMEVALPSSPVSSVALLNALLSADSYVFVGQHVLAQRSGSGHTADTSMEAGLAAMLEHLEGLERAGGMLISNTPTQILRGADGAAVVFPFGTPKPISIDVPVSEETVTNLRTHQSTAIPTENSKLEFATSSDPTMVKGLPVRTWVVPAGLWMESDMSAAGPVGSIPVRFGWANRTGLSFTGTLETVCPDRIALLPRTQVVNLGPGETLTVLGRLQGRAEPGTTLPIRLVLTSPGGPPVERVFPLTVPPALLWQVPVETPGRYALTLADVDGDSAAEVVCAASDAVSVWSGSGAFRWRSKIPGAGSRPVAPGRLGSDQPYVAAPSESGVEVLDATGTTLWHGSLPGGARTVRTGNLHIAPGQEVVAGSEKGTVSAFLSNGGTLWSTPTDGPVTDVETEDLDGDGRDECLVLADGLVAVDGAANELWRVLEGSGDSSCPMLIADLNGDWQWNVVVGLANGTVAVVDAAAGEVLHQELVASEPVIGIACGELLGNPGQEVLIATDERLFCLSTALETRWEIPLELSGAPAVTGAGPEARILAPTRNGALVRLDGTGIERWRDERAAGAIAGTPLVVAASDADREVCIFGSEDGFIRAIMLPE